MTLVHLPFGVSLSVVLATINGLSQVKAPEEVAMMRGKAVDEIFA